MKRLATILVLLAGWFAVAHADEAEMKLSSKKVREEVRTVVAAQLAALQAGDFTEAYSHAAAGIKRQFDARVFALMVKRGYPALLRKGKIDLGSVRDDSQGSANIVVTVTDALNHSTTYRYWLVLEDGWRISGVVLEQKPPRGDI